MRFAVLLHEDSHIAKDIHLEGLDLLRQHGQVDVVTMKRGQGQAELEPYLALMKAADAAVISPWHWPKLKPEHWRSAENLKVFAGTFDNRFEGWVDFDYLESRGIPLIDTSRSMTPTVAEFALALTLMLIRDIPNMLFRAREGGWHDLAYEGPDFLHADLTGRRVGLAGLGSINQRYAELLAPFNCEILVCDPFVPDELIAQYGGKRVDSLVELAQRSEIFNIGIPPMASTLEIIDRDVIYALPRRSLLVLTTRMQVVEQAPLWERLKANEIAAALDVFAPEPPPADAWFRNRPNIIVTPHIAGGTTFCHERCFTEACKDALAVLQGQKTQFQATKRDYLLYEGRLASAD
jgi:phosphoglycerate dehydrogenase-like enzyme